MAKKFYVVWQGRKPGIYTDWPSAQAQVDKFPAAKFKSFKTRAEAEAAFKGETGQLASPMGDQPPAKFHAKPKHSANNGVATLSEADVKTVAADIKIFTDGGCDPNPGKAGSGMAIYQNEQLHSLWYGLFNPHGTNNTAELNALYQAMLKAEEFLQSGLTVAIFCDSKYSIQCITQWAEGWQKKGWKKAGGEIKNLELIQTMFALYQKLKERIQILHVNGHIGIEGNELADRMSMVAVGEQQTDFVRYAEPMDIDFILTMQHG